MSFCCRLNKMIHLVACDRYNSRSLLFVSAPAPDIFYIFGGVEEDMNDQQKTCTGGPSRHLLARVN